MAGSARYRAPIEVRFATKVVWEPNNCWRWTAATDHGYGRFGINGKSIPAHRFAYERLVGPIPDGLHLDHLCRNRSCVNPAHLEPVTPRENVLRGVGPSAINAARTECAVGHPFTPENTYRRGRNRSCLICRRASALKWYYANKETA